jgi:prepilin-type N-terminal cleavage/methylation domain-containing protein
MIRGFTLIELLVYIALLSFMLTGLFFSAIQLHDSAFRSKEAARELIELINERDSHDQGLHL